jgi:hypothetical protein
MAKQDNEYELIEDNLKSAGDQSPTRELDSDFPWIPRKHVRAKPECEAEEEECRGWYRLILIQDTPASSHLKWCVLKAHMPVYTSVVSIC